MTTLQLKTELQNSLCEVSAYESLKNVFSGIDDERVSKAREKMCEQLTKLAQLLTESAKLKP